MLAESSALLKRRDTTASRGDPLGVTGAKTEEGPGIFSLIDGVKTKAVETDADIKTRKEFLLKIG